MAKSKAPRKSYAAGLKKKGGRRVIANTLEWVKESVTLACDRDAPEPKRTFAACRAALQRIREGVGEKSDVAKLLHSILVTEELDRLVCGKEGLPFNGNTLLVAAFDVYNSVTKRLKKFNKVEMLVKEYEAYKCFMDFHETFVMQCTVIEIETAVRRIIARKTNEEVL